MEFQNFIKGCIFVLHLCASTWQGAWGENLRAAPGRSWQGAAGTRLSPGLAVAVLLVLRGLKEVSKPGALLSKLQLRRCNSLLSPEKQFVCT